MRNVIACLMLLALLTSAAAAGAAPPRILLPPGFQIEVFADDLPGARSLRLGDKGTVFVGTREVGSVYALRDEDGDGRAESHHTIARGLDMPNGIAFQDGALYVAEVQRILRYPDIEVSLSKPPTPQVVRDDLPSKTHHGWRYIGFGPDRKLYLALGAPCNSCRPERFRRGSSELEFASITRMNADGSDWEVIARGVRNSLGFDWDPQSGALWFTDNGRDWLGENEPDCELNRLTRVGEHFGFPWCHAGTVSDPEFGSERRCSEFTAPQASMGPHVAPLGLRFYTGRQFPAEYRGQLFVALHGSWNRSRKSGYTLNLVRLKDGQVVGHEVFASGWMVKEKTLGRPADVLVMPDGSLLVSDDHGGRIWRISYGAGPEPRR